MATSSSPCPHCQGLSIWLENLSQESYVDYYRCSKCSLVWNVPKGTSGMAQEVTIVAAGRSVKANK
jgi:hypothetical protein